MVILTCDRSTAIELARTPVSSVAPDRSASAARWRSNATRSMTTASVDGDV
jgi:hypothetical protein